MEKQHLTMRNYETAHLGTDLRIGAFLLFAFAELSSGCFLFSSSSSPPPPSRVSAAPERDAGPAHSTCSGGNSIHAAVLSCDLSALEKDQKLLRQYSSFPCSSGLTPLMLMPEQSECGEDKQITIIAALLRAGADPNSMAPCKGNEWCTVLDIAQTALGARAIQILREHGAKSWTQHVEEAKASGASDDAVSTAIRSLALLQQRKKVTQPPSAEALGALALNLEKDRVAAQEFERLQSQVAVSHSFKVDQQTLVERGVYYLDTDWFGKLKVQKTADTEWQRSSGTAYDLMVENKGPEHLLVDVRVSVVANKNTQRLFSGKETKLSDLGAEIVHLIVPPKTTTVANGYLPLTADTKGIIFDADELSFETQARILDVASVSKGAIADVKRVTSEAAVTKVSTKLLSAKSRGDRKLGFILRMQWERLHGPLQDSMPVWDKFEISAIPEGQGPYDPDFPRPYSVQFTNKRESECYVHWEDADGTRFSRPVPAMSTKEQKREAPGSGRRLDVRILSLSCDDEPDTAAALIATFLPLDRWSLPGSMADDSCVVFVRSREVVLNVNPKGCWIGTWDGKVYRGSFPPDRPVRAVSALDSVDRNIVRLEDTQGVVYISSLGGVGGHRFLIWERVPR